MMSEEEEEEEEEEEDDDDDVSPSPLGSTRKESSLPFLLPSLSLSLSPSLSDVQ
eukprot:gnl/Chilomastix_caulleri/6110.p2 GENE.gnl/Chilomastix_caulleri/6110~~gnl/Chilomastix_caulleri/6110.p2  ORF type:complete len:54 (-),score=28.58 gnl/Chilomastix_caulleri/6110:1-162(-)